MAARPADGSCPQQTGPWPENIGIRVCGFCSLKPPPCGASRPAGNACVGVWPAGAAGAGGVSAAGEHGRASHTKFLTNSKRDAPRRGAENFQQTLKKLCGASLCWALLNVSLGNGVYEPTAAKNAHGFTVYWWIGGSETLQRAGIG